MTRLDLDMRVHVSLCMRLCVCVSCVAIIEEFGGKWAMERLLPAAFGLYDKTTNYLHRMTVLLLIEHCGTKCGAEITEKSLLPYVLTAATDDVPNGTRASGDQPRTFYAETRDFAHSHACAPS